jgi:hypothetical protein
MFGLMLLTLYCGARCVSAPDSAISWRYDLRTGDHLVYRETFRQEIDGPASIDDRNTIRLEAQHVRRLRLLLRPSLFSQPGNVKRLEQIQQTVDSIAIEVERIAEAQRFTAKLANERSEAKKLQG